MKRVSKWRVDPKVLIISSILVLLVAVLFLSIQTGEGPSAQNEAIEGGELALTSVGRNYESIRQFVRSDEEQTRQLLEAARVALDKAEAKLNSARRSSDEYLLGMLDSYQRVANASAVMSQGLDNLLLISKNMTDAFYYYSKNDYDKASEEASYCLQVLRPLVGDFKASNASLASINVFYIPSGHRDQLPLRVNQFENETETYNQYILLLDSLIKGKEYLQKNDVLEEAFRKLQEAINKKDYQAAENRLQEISEILQSLRDSKYQTVAEIASKLEPSMLGGQMSSLAQELKLRLRNLAGVDNLETYRQATEKYLEASRNLDQNEISQAEQAINEGLGILGQGQGGDLELQGMYAGLRRALNTLQQRIKGQPEQG